MHCTFCSIVAGEEDALILDETDETLAFAPLDPVSEGHLLIIPKDHYRNVFDVPRSTLHAILDRAKAIAERLRTHDFEGVNLLHASGRAAQQSVLHFHVHLVPRRADDNLDLWPESKYEETDFEHTYENVRAALGNHGGRSQ